MERKVRRVQVTASVPGASEPVGQIAAPAELRTPTGMELTLAHGKCGWKRGDSANRDQQATKRACHFLHRYYMDRSHPSRLPSGSLRSALTGPGCDPSANVPRGGNGRCFDLAFGRSNTRRSTPDTVLKTNELTNLLTRPAFSWKGRSRTADASLFRDVRSITLQSFLYENKKLT